VGLLLCLILAMSWIVINLQRFGVR
jgi:hypothetical protein